jgi:hypothetical protein
VKVEATLEGDSATDLAVARMNSDNLDDIVVVNDSTFNQNLGAIVFGAGNGRFRVNNPFVVDFGATSITLADFDAAADRATDPRDALRRRRRTGPSEYRRWHRYRRATHSFDWCGVIGDGRARVGDLGGDTLPDFIVLSEAGDQMRVAIISRTGDADVRPTTPVTSGTPTPTGGPPPPTGAMTSTGTPTASAARSRRPITVAATASGRYQSRGDRRRRPRRRRAANLGVRRRAGVVRLVFNTALADVACARHARAADHVHQRDPGRPHAGSARHRHLDHDGVNGSPSAPAIACSS